MIHQTLKWKSLMVLRLLTRTDPKHLIHMANIVIMDLKAKVLQIIDGFQRVDIVFDTYQQNTIKSDIGMSVRFSVRQDTLVYKKFQDFMRCDDNRTELFQIISSSLSKINCPTQIATTKFSNVKSNCNIRYHKSSTF